MIYFIPTPIWNLKDITLRALILFKELNLFFCEDTRTFKQLLQKYDINYENKKFYSLTSYTDKSKINFYTNLLKENDAGIISDAWTPWFSDPWKEIIKIAWENNIEFDVLPWTNSLIPAIVSAFFDTSKFLYLWFLPKKKWRQTIMKMIVDSSYPVFIYESVHRIYKTLSQLKELWFMWDVFIIREISKLYQTKYFWNIEEILKKFENNEIKIKWEFVIWLNSKIK